MLKCYIEEKNLINNNPETYNIVEGSVFVENGNETLDSGTIILAQLKNKIDIEPYDVMIIYSDENSKYKINERRMCVDTYTCTQTSLDPAIYKYEITLFSETKLLEGILCPSLSITKLKLTSGARTIWFYLNQYLNEYGTKTKVNPNNLAKTNKFSYAPRVQEMFNVECPELQWNEPTLREVLTDLMMVKDCIPIVKNNVIDYMYLGQNGNEITKEQRKDINYITETQSSQDYVSEIKMNVKNGLNNPYLSAVNSYGDKNAPQSATLLTEEIGYKNYDTYQLTTERLKLETQLPIWKIYYCGLVNRVWGIVNCKREEDTEIITNGNFANGLSDWTLEGKTGDNTTLKVVNNEAIIHCSFSSANTYARFFKNKDFSVSDFNSNVFHYKVVLKTNDTSGIGVSFEFRLDTQSTIIKVNPSNEFQTFEGDITIDKSRFVAFSIALPVELSGKDVVIKSVSITGKKYIKYSHNFEQNNLLKIEKNITNYILEYNLWQTKDIYYAGSNSTQSFSTDWQNTCLYFKRGQKGIFNFSATQTYKVLWIENQIMVHELMISDVASIGRTLLLNEAKKIFPPSEGYIEFSIFNFNCPTNPGACRFKMIYEPIEDCTFRASKYPLVRNKREIIDNQTNSYVDVERLGMLEYLKAKRLGNKIKIVNGRYKKDEKDLPTIFDKINGSIIFKKEISVYENYIIANYQATENYVLRDYFTSVKSKLRSWRIVGENEAFIRADLLKFYAGKNCESIDNEVVKLPSYQTVEEYLENFKYCVVQFNTRKDGTKPSNPDYNYYYNFDGGLNLPVNVTSRRMMNALMVEFSKHKCNNSVVFTFKMLDNTLAGKYVYNNYEFKNVLGWTATLIGFSSTIGGQQRNIKYTDEDGEITGGVIRFFNKIHAPDLFQTDPCFSPSMRPLVNLNGQDSFGSRYDGNFQDDDGLVAKIPFTIHKDNKEILQISIQFEISDEADDMFVGKK